LKNYGYVIAFVRTPLPRIRTVSLSLQVPFYGTIVTTLHSFKQATLSVSSSYATVKKIFPASIENLF